VNTTVRSPNREAQVRQTLALKDDPRLSFFTADLTRDDGWGAAASGCTYALHVASPLPTTLPKSDDDLVIPAREGALRALKVCKAAGVKRLVMTSSTAAVTYGLKTPATRPFTEADWTDPASADTSPYVRSKTLAERAAWDWHAKFGAGVELVTVCPGAVLGPVLGADYSASIEIVKKLLEGSLPGSPRLGFPLVDVRDIADLHVRAMTHPEAAGQRFLGAGDFWWMADIAQVLREGLGEGARKVPPGRVPDWLLKFLANFDPVTKSVVFELGVERPVDASKAQTMLGWTMRPAEVSILDTAQSLIRIGAVK
jgi:nucleoside-diphosphate-sugar epimerase